MRNITPGEMLSLSALLQMETRGLEIAGAGVKAITDPQLKNLAESGITTTKGRIAGLQQFIAENQLTDVGGLH